MKSLIFAAAMALSALGNARELSCKMSSDQTEIQSQRVAVRPEDLPEAVKSGLSSEGYAEFKVSSAYLVTRDDRSQYYELHLKKGEEGATVNLDKYGKKVD